jgi:hypothetical protein
VPDASPQVADVYKSDKSLLLPGDPRPHRPVGVVRAAAAGKVVTLGRTTTTTEAGVHTPAGILPYLDEDGVFALRWQKVTPVRHFGTAKLEYKGTLPEPYAGKMATVLQDAELEAKLRDLRM